MPLLPLVCHPWMVLLPLFVTPAIFKPGSMVLKNSGFPIKDFGNDGRGVTPEWFYEGSKQWEGKNLWMPDKKFQAWRKRGIPAWISGMTRKETLDSFSFPHPPRVRVVYSISPPSAYNWPGKAGIKMTHPLSYNPSNRIEKMGGIFYFFNLTP